MAPRRAPRRGRVAAGRPGCDPVAVEEYLRYFSPLAHIGRTATHDVELDGRTVRTGDLVSLCFAAANHDPRVFDAPDECRLDRRPNRHVAFGHGPHTCIGAPLARMQVAVVVERFLAMVGSCSVVTPVEWQPRSIDTVTTGSAFPEPLVLQISPERST